jgi:hypothetical protein
MAGYVSAKSPKRQDSHYLHVIVSSFDLYQKIKKCATIIARWGMGPEGRETGLPESGTVDQESIKTPH